MSIPHVGHVYSDDQNSGLNMFIYLQYGGKFLRTLLDTGSQINLVKRSFAKVNNGLLIGEWIFEVLMAGAQHMDL